MKNLRNIYYSVSMFLLGVPVAFAAPYTTGGIPAAPKNISEMACIVTKLTLSFIPYLVVIAVGFFLSGLIRYIGHGDDEEKRGEGIKMMIYGTLGFFFMVGIWGILRIFTQSFDIPLLIPQFKASGPGFAQVCK